MLAISQHIADLVAAYHAILKSSPTSLLNQPLLTMNSGARQCTVTVKILSKALDIMLKAGMDCSPVILSGHIYVTSPCVNQSSMVAALAATVAGS